MPADRCSLGAEHIIRYAAAESSVRGDTPLFGSWTRQEFRHVTVGHLKSGDSSYEEGGSNLGEVLRGHGLVTH